MENTEILREISNKLTVIHEDLKKLLQHNKNFCSNEIPELMNNLSTQICQIENNERNITPVPSTFSEDSVYIARKPIIQTWKRNLNERKQHFWNFLRFQNTAVIYETWLGKETPILPRKFRPKFIPAEHEEDKKLRYDNAVNNFDTEIKLLKNKAVRHEQKFTQKDEEMECLIQDKIRPERQQDILKLWKNECEKEEKISYNLWQKKQEWLENYETNFRQNDVFTKTSDEFTVVNNQPRQKRRNRNPVEHSSPTHTDNIFHSKGTTYIGQRVRNHFLGQRRRDRGGGTQWKPRRINPRPARIGQRRDSEIILNSGSARPEIPLQTTDPYMMEETRVKTLRSVTYPVEMEEQYNLYDGNKPKRGLAYIIVNQTFKGDFYKDRLGAYKDYQNMKKLFKPLGFKLLTFLDKSAKDMLDILKEASQRKDLSDRSCFVCVISSHGEEWRSQQVHGSIATMEHVLVGSDGKLVRTKTLIDMFNDSNCPALANKPKMFFLQACRENVYEKDRSKALDHGVELKVFQHMIDKKRRRKNFSKSDAADASPISPEDMALSEEMRASYKPETSSDTDISDDDELSDAYNTDTTDNESDEEDACRDKNKVKITQLPNVAEPTDVAPVPEGSVPHSGSGDKKPEDADDAGKKTGSSRVNTRITPFVPIEVVDVPCYNDMCVMFASPPGKLAWRSTVQGGWLLANLYNVVKYYVRQNYLQKKDFLSILTEVSHDIAIYWETDTEKEEFTGKKMIPVVHHQLVKDLVFEVVKPPGVLGKLKALLK